MTREIKVFINKNIHLFSDSWLLTNHVILLDKNLNTLLKVGYDILIKGNRKFELETKADAFSFFEKEDIVTYKSSLLAAIDDPNSNNIKHFIHCLQILDISDICHLMGQKTSTTSLISVDALPPSEIVLITACYKPYNSFISQIEKQLDKHAGRNNNSFWPKLDGNSHDKKKSIQDLIHYFLFNIDWWNIYCHYQHDYVYEIRIQSGYGMRWSQNGEQFIGFLEPYISYENKV